MNESIVEAIKQRDFELKRARKCTILETGPNSSVQNAMLLI